MNKVLWLLISIIALGLIGLWWMIWVAPAKAFNDHACDEGQAGEHNPHCIASPTPSPTPTPSPSKTPCPSPTATPVPSVSPQASASPEPEVTPTPAPSVEPTPNPQPDQPRGGANDGGDGKGCAVNDCSTHYINNSGLPLQPPSASGK